MQGEEDQGDQGTLGEEDSGGGAPAGSDDNGTQPARQVEAGAQGTGGEEQLPFTGFAAIPILLGGVALLTTGLVLRRRAGETPARPASHRTSVGAAHPRPDGRSLLRRALGTEVGAPLRRLRHKRTGISGITTSAGVFPNVDAYPT